MPSPDFAAYNLQPLSRATEQPQGHFFDALLAIGANGLRTVEDGIQFQLSSLEPTNACGRMPHRMPSLHAAHSALHYISGPAWCGRSRGLWPEGGGGSIPPWAPTLGCRDPLPNPHPNPHLIAVSPETSPSPSP